MDEKKSKFNGLKRLFFTDQYFENQNTANDPPKEKIEPIPQSKIHLSVNLNTNSIDSESGILLEKIYKYLDSINSPEIDFIEVWDSMDEMGGVNETNLKATFAAMKIASKGALTKDVIINTGQGYLSKISDQLNQDINAKSIEIDNLELKKKNESIFLVNKKKEIEDQIIKLQSELTQTKSLINDLESKYSPKLNEIQIKIAAGQDSINKIGTEINAIISLVNKTL